MSKLSLKKKTSNKKNSTKNNSIKKTSKINTSKRKNSTKNNSIKQTSKKNTSKKKTSKKNSNKLKKILKKTNNNTENQYIKNLTFRELDELPNFENSYISQCKKSANNRIKNKNISLSYQINQNDIEKYCACTYKSLVLKKKSINDLESEIYNNIKECVKKFNKTTKRFSKNKNIKKNIKLLKK